MTEIRHDESAFRARAARYACRTFSDDDGAGQTSLLECDGQLIGSIRTGTPAHDEGPIERLTHGEAWHIILNAFTALSDYPDIDKRQSTFLLNQCLRLLNSADAPLLLEKRRPPMRPAENQQRDLRIIDKLAFAEVLGIPKVNVAIAADEGVTARRVNQIREEQRGWFELKKAWWFGQILRMLDRETEPELRFFAFGARVAIVKGS